MPNDPEFPEEKGCDCCGFGPDVELSHYDVSPDSIGRGASPTKDLCKLCGATSAGTVLDFTGKYTEAQADILRAICFVGNVILAEIRKDGQ